MHKDISLIVQYLKAHSLKKWVKAGQEGIKWGCAVNIEFSRQAGISNLAKELSQSPGPAGKYIMDFFNIHKQVKRDKTASIKWKGPSSVIQYRREARASR